MAVKYTYNYKLPLFVPSTSRAYLVKHEKNRVSDIWGFLDYLVKTHAHKRNPRQEQFLQTLLEQAIRKYPNWAIINRSSFIVKTDNDNDGKGSKIVTDNLTQYIDNDKEKILIAHISRPISWRNFKI